MARLLISFVFVYGLLNLYVLNRARVFFPGRAAVTLFMLLFLVLAVLAPILAHLAESIGREATARVVAVLGFSWMGFVFLAFWIFLTADVIALFAKLTHVAPKLYNPVLKTRGAVTLLFSVAAAVFLYGLIEAHSLRTERVTITTAKLPSSLDRLRIVQISDVHLGLLAGEEWLKKILAKVQQEEPDLLVATGDLIDGDMAGRQGILDLLQAVRPPLGKYAVMGNHEHYVGLGRSLEFLQKAGFRVLRGEGVEVGGLIVLAGVDDPARGPVPDETMLLTSLQSGLFLLFLKHRPDVNDKSQALFDLQLSGHTHRGQIFPFRLFTGIPYPMQDGLVSLKSGSKLYTSRGAGTWGPPIRVLSPPEITVIDLVATRVSN